MAQLFDMARARLPRVPGAVALCPGPILPERSLRYRPLRSPASPGRYPKPRLRAPSNERPSHHQGGGVVYNDFANVDISLGIIFSSGVLAALGSVWLITGNRNKLVAYSKEQADQFDVGQKPPCTSAVLRVEEVVAYKDLEPFSKLEAARHDRRPSFVCGIAASMSHAREETIVHHVDKHKALERLVEAHDDECGAASLLFFGECAAQRHHLRVQAAVDLQEQRRHSWNPAVGYALAFEQPPPDNTTPLRRSAFVMASPRQCDVQPQVFKPTYSITQPGFLPMVRLSSHRHSSGS